MRKRPHPRGHPAVRGIQLVAGAVVALAFALVPTAASAQEAAGGSDQDRVMIVTAVVSIVALAACAVGYAYRRMRGMDHPTPDELEMMGHDGHHDESAADAHGDQAVHPHAEAEHPAAAAAPRS